MKASVVGILAVMALAMGSLACGEGSGMDGPSQTSYDFFHRFEKFDTSGMSQLVCPEMREDFESAMLLTQSFLGLGGMFGVTVDGITWEDAKVTTVHSDDTNASVLVGGRMNFGTSLGSMPLDREVPLRLNGDTWCLADDPREALS